MVIRATYQNFRQHLDKVLVDFLAEGEKLQNEHLRNLFFGNYMYPDADPRIYDEVCIILFHKLKFE